MIGQLKVSLVTAQLIDSSEEISQLTTIVNSIPDNSLPSDIDAMLPPDAERLLDYSVAQSAIASDQEIAIINSITEPVVTPDPVVTSDSAPVASAVSITGVAKVGQTLTGSYTYTDADSDPEGASIYGWLRNGSPISGATGTDLYAGDGGPGGEHCL